MKNNNIIRPTGLKGNEKINRMRTLMGMGSINESVENTHSVVELNKLGPDGKVYGVVRENHEYYIKIADNKPNLVSEDFKYIGGLQNKKEVVYESYAKAIKQLNLKFINLNEALGNVGEINTFKNDNLLGESFESYNEAPKSSQPDKLMGTVKSPGKNDGHESEIINDSGETGNPDVDTPPVVEEDDVVEGEEALEENDDVELTEGEKAIDRIIRENTVVATEKIEKVEETVVERRMSIATALQKIDEGVNSKKKVITETKFKLKLDNPSPEPVQDMGSPVPTEDPMSDPMSDPMGEPEASDKPFDDEPFDAGVEASEEDSPEKYIQQLSGKLGQSLRKYTDEMGQPDFDLEKFAINSVLSATNSGEMDDKDQNDIINKVKNSSTNGGGEEDGGLPNPDDMPDDESNDNEGDGVMGDDELDFNNIDMEESVIPKEPVSKEFIGKKVSVDFRKEIGIIKDYDDKDVVVYFPSLGFTEKINYKLVEVRFVGGQFAESFNPNINSKTVFKNATLGVDNDGMEENKYLNLESIKKSSIFVNKTKIIRNMIRQTLNESPTVIPETKPTTTPTRTPSRRSKPWTIIPEGVPDPEPKGEVTPITFIRHEKFTDNDVVITFDVGDVEFVETFTNTGEVIEKPMDYDEPWVYKFETEPLSNNKVYNVAVDFYGNPHTNLELEGFNGSNTNVGEIEES